MMDMGLTKDIVSGGILKTEVMYANTRDILVMFKIFFLTNHLLKFPYDKGALRRGIGKEFKNKFVPAHELACETKKNPDINVYEADVHLINKFQTEEFKNAFIHLLKPWWKYLYQNKKLYNQEKYSSMWAEMAKVNDTFGTFLEDMFIVTNDENDSVGKREIQQLYEHYYRSKLSDARLHSHLKQNQLQYKSALRDRNGNKGVILGLKLRTIDDDEEEACTFAEEETRKLRARIKGLERELEEMKQNTVKKAFVKKPSKKLSPRKSKSADPCLVDLL